MDKPQNDLPRSGCNDQKILAGSIYRDNLGGIPGAGAKISGFRASRKRLAERISSGDYLLCYLTGISRFIGILEVKSKCYEDATPIWRDERFPIRFDVELVEKLDARTAVPVLSLKDELEIFRGLKSRNAWTGFFRGSPAEFSVRGWRSNCPRNNESRKESG